MHVIFWTFFCFVRPSSTENDEYSSTSTSICLIQKFSRYVCIYNTCWRILKKCKRKPQIYYHINTCERAFQRGRLKRSLYYQEQEHTRRKRATIIRAFNGKIQVMNTYMLRSSMFDRSKPKIGCSSSITKRWTRSSLFDVRKNDVRVCSMSNLGNLVKAL